MFGTQEIEIPPESILGLVHQGQGVFADAYAIDVPNDVTLSTFISAFYTSRAFLPERWIMRIAASKTTSSSMIDVLAQGQGTRFAVWRVVERREDEIYLRDASGRTASWLAVRQGQLIFGSAVYPVTSKTGEQHMGWLFHALLGFHKAYSRLLLWSAARRLQAVPTAGTDAL